MDAATRVTMKNHYQQQKYEKYCSSFAQHLPLWRIDDKDWVAQRKKAWSAIEEREKQEDQFFVKAEWEALGRFFLRGSPRVSDKPLSTDKQIRLIPFESTEQILEIFRAQHVSHRQGLHEKALRLTSHMLRACPDEFHRVELMARALYGTEWVECKEPMGIDHKPGYVVTYPREAVRCYLSDAASHLRRSESAYREQAKRKYNSQFTGLERSYVEVTVEYFLQSLAVALDESRTSFGEDLDRSDFEAMHDLVKIADTCRPDAGNPHIESFLQQLRETIIPHRLFQKALSVPL